MRNLIAALISLAFLAVPAWATTTIDPSDPGIYYSPACWNVQTGSATTVGAGCYFRTQLIGTTTAVLNFNVTNGGTNPSEIEWRLDGAAGTWTVVQLTKACCAFGGTGIVTLTFPSITGASYGNWSQHTLEVYVKSIDYANNSWTAFSSTENTAVILNSIVVDTSATATLPQVAAKKILVLGDSITQSALNVCGSVAGLCSTVPQQYDSMLGYPLAFQMLLGAEVSVAGFASQGWTTVGTGNVPPFPSSYNLLYQGVSRSFAGLDMVMILQGQNSAPTSAAQVAGVLNGMASAGMTGKIMVICPLNVSNCNAEKSTFIAGIAAATNPSQSVFIDTSSFNLPSGCLSGGVHPLGWCDVGYVAPQIAALVFPYLYPTTTQTTPTFKPGFAP